MPKAFKQRQAEPKHQSKRGIMSHRDYECEVCGTDVCEQEPSAAEEAAHLAACEAAMLGNGEREGKGLGAEFMHQPETGVVYLSAP